MISSLSGHERNPLFLNRKGEEFEDISLISGADSDRDGRTVVLWDYNKDGFLDLAVVNANAPRLAIYENQLGKRLADRGAVMIRFSGAAGQSNRDGYGTVVKAKIGERVFRSEHQCGAGFAAQNAPFIHIGLGQAKVIDELTIRWSTGAVQVLSKIPAGSLLRAQEGRAAVVETYGEK